MTAPQRPVRAAWRSQQDFWHGSNQQSRSESEPHRTSEGNFWKWIFGPSPRPQIYAKLLLDMVAGDGCWNMIRGLRGKPGGTPCPMKKKTSVRLTGFYLA